MKVKLLTKLTSVAALSLVITACGEGPEYEDAEAYKNAQPPIVDGDLNLTLNEESMVEVIDLFQGVTNPSETIIYARDFQFVSELVDENDVATPNYEGPMLPFTAVSRTGNELFIDTDTWKELLVHSATVAERDALDVNTDDNPDNDTAELYSTGVYRFTYKLDNGADEIVERNITLTVNAIEDPVTDVEINNTDGFSIAKGYTIPLSTTVLPLNATFPQLTYVSSDESIATIDANGVITGVEFGNVTFTVTSADGEVQTTVSGVVEALSAPIGVGIQYNGSDVTQLTLPVDSTFDLESVLLPVSEGFTDEVMWSVEPQGIIDIDDMTGEITGLTYDSEDTTANTATVTAYLVNDPDTKGVVSVTTGPSANLLKDVNADFETGVMTPWAQQWEGASVGATATVNAESANNSNFGIHIQGDGSKHTGLALPDTKTPQVVIDTSKKFVLTYDIKINNWVAGGNYAMRFMVVGGGTWPQRIEKWHNPSAQGNFVAGEWTPVTIEFDPSVDNKAGAGAAFGENPYHLEIFDIGGNGAVDFQIDNISLIEVN